MLIEMLPSILLTGLWDTFPVGVTVNTLKTFPSVDRNAMMTAEATDFNQCQINLSFLAGIRLNVLSLD